MKLLFIIDSLRIGGAQRVTLQLLNTLKSSGYSVHLVIYRRQFDLNTFNDIPVKFVDIPFLNGVGIRGFLYKAVAKILGHNFIWFFSKYFSKVLSREVDLESFNRVILCSDSAISPFHKIEHPKKYFWLHSYKSKQFFNNYISKLLSSLTMKNIFTLFSEQNLLCVSQDVAYDVVHNLHCNPKSINFFYNYIDDKMLNELASQYKVEFYHKYICHVGRHSKEKRIDILLHSLKILNKGKNEPLHLVLVGDGPNTKQLKKEAEKLGVSEQVHFIGYQSNPYPYIKNSKALVLSSEREGLPTVLIEALRLNIPIVSTECKSGPSEIMTGGFSQFLAKVNEPEDLALKINLCLSKKIDDFEFEDVLVPFSFQNTVGKFLKLVDVE